MAYRSFFSSRAKYMSTPRPPTATATRLSTPAARKPPIDAQRKHKQLKTASCSSRGSKANTSATVMVPASNTSGPLPSVFTTVKASIEEQYTAAGEPSLPTSTEAKQTSTKTPMPALPKVAPAKTASKAHIATKSTGASAKRSSFQATLATPGSKPLATMSQFGASGATSPATATKTADSSHLDQPDPKRSKRQLAQSQLVELLQMHERLEAAPAVVRRRVQKLMSKVLCAKLANHISIEVYRPIDVIVTQCIWCKHTADQWYHLIRLLAKTGRASQAAQAQIEWEQAAIQRIVSIDQVISKVPHARWAPLRTGLTMLAKAIYTGDEPADAWEQVLKAVEYGQKMNTDQIWTLVCAGLPSGR
eukprot:TRINITY_DN11116_c0_g1_i1.p1 TRINITY_DN11116_c0_g1~~TRINITY_DN11116_c0_g1_i1.p1  ORF type:complete len:362 (+),score=67.57 TRINITY_DN11116_c0_g1_i1:628-1713(+)